MEAIADENTKNDPYVEPQRQASAYFNWVGTAVGENRAVARDVEL